ncbi:hypothetical protein DXG01_008864, partial [Tephrocybe rancida]
GNVALNSRKGVFCIDDIFQGVAIYRLDTGTRTRTYTVQNAKTARPKAVTFAEDCSLIIAASDHGIVHVFDRRSGIMVDQLKAGSHRIQAIAVSPQTYSVIHGVNLMQAMELNDTSHVFAAIKRNGGDDSDIIVWKKSNGVTGTAKESLSTAFNFVRFSLQLLVIVAAAAFLV